MTLWTTWLLPLGQVFCTPPRVCCDGSSSPSHAEAGRGGDTGVDRTLGKQHGKLWMVEAWLTGMWPGMELTKDFVCVPWSLIK